MTTRRTTMRSRSGTKLYAVRDESGQFKDIQTYKRAHAADLRHKSKAEKEAAQGPIEKSVRKAANNAVKSVRSSVKGAVAAVQRVAKRAVKQVSNPQPAAKETRSELPEDDQQTGGEKDSADDGEEDSEEGHPQARGEEGLTQEAATRRSRRSQPSSRTRRGACRP